MDIDTFLQRIIQRREQPMVPPGMEQELTSVPGEEDMRRSAMGHALRAAGNSRGLLPMLLNGVGEYQIRTSPEAKRAALLDAYKAAGMFRGVEDQEDTSSIELLAGEDRRQRTNKQTDQSMRINAAQEQRAVEGFDLEKDQVQRRQKRQTILDSREDDEYGYNKSRRGVKDQRDAIDHINEQVAERRKQLGLDNPDALMDEEQRTAAEDDLRMFEDDLYTSYQVYTKKRPAQVGSKADFDALPSGAYFINPKDKKLMRKK